MAAPKADWMAVHSGFQMVEYWAAQKVAHSVDMTGPLTAALKAALTVASKG